MTQLQMLGLGLLIVAAICAVTGRSFGRNDHLRFKGMQKTFTRQSHPGLFEAYEKTLRTITALGVILGLFFLLIRP